MSEEKSAHEVMQIFRDEERIHCLEQSHAIEGLNKICSAMGYGEQCYSNGSSLEEFLRDNPGCCEAIVEWITDNMSEEWKEGLSFEDEPEDDDPDIKETENQSECSYPSCSEGVFDKENETGM